MSGLIFAALPQGYRDPGPDAGVKRRNPGISTPDFAALHPGYSG